MNTDQALDLLKTGVIQGVLVPLGAALVAGIASGLQEKLSAGIQSRSDRSKLEFHRQRMETIKELLTETASSIRNRQRARLQGELNLIAAELPLLSHRRAVAKRSQADVLGWQRLPRWRRIFTLPRPRSLQGFMATGLFFWFLYLSALTIITSTKWASIRGGAELFTFLLVIISSIVLPVLIGVASRYSALRAGTKKDIESWRKHNQLVRALTLPVPSSAAQLLPSLIWFGVVAWLAIWGLGVTLWLYWGLFHQTFAIELHIQHPEAFIPGSILSAFFIVSAIYARNFAIIYARKSVRSLRRTGLSW